MIDYRQTIAPEISPAAKRQVRWFAFFLALGFMLTVFLAYKVKNAEARTEPASGSIPSQNLLAGYAASYAVAHAQQLSRGFPISEGAVRLSPGNSSGQTLAPTIDQLSAMGFAPQDAPRGAVFIDIEQSCLGKTCSTVATAVASYQGATAKAKAFGQPIQGGKPATRSVEKLSASGLVWER